MARDATARASATRGRQPRRPRTSSSSSSSLTAMCPVAADQTTAVDRSSRTIQLVAKGVSARLCQRRQLASAHGSREGSVVLRMSCCWRAASAPRTTGQGQLTTKGNENRVAAGGGRRRRDRELACSCVVWRCSGQTESVDGLTGGGKRARAAAAAAASADGEAGASCSSRKQRAAKEGAPLLLQHCCSVSLSTWQKGPTACYLRSSSVEKKGREGHADGEIGPGWLYARSLFLGTLAPRQPLVIRVQPSPVASWPSTTTPSSPSSLPSPFSMSDPIIPQNAALRVPGLQAERSTSSSRTSSQASTHR